MTPNLQGCFVAALAAVSLTGCARTEAPPGTPILKSVKLAGGDCVGPQSLPEGWRLNAQVLDPDNPDRPLSLVLFKAPEPGFKSFTKGYTVHDGLIEAQVRDTSDIPYFGGAAGKRSYDDVIRDTVRRSSGERRSIPAGGVTLTALRMGQDTELMVGDDPAQTLLTCNPPGGTGEPECKVTTAFRDGRYRMITAFSYDRHPQYREMIAQAQAVAEKAIGACPA
jgi:hypothetical protein